MGSGGSKSKAPETKPSPPQDDNNNKEEPTRIANKGGPPYEPFRDFPDYQKLVGARKDFAASTYDIDNDKDGVPLPFPTTTTGASALSNDRKIAIDIHVKMVDMELSRDAGKLVSYLTKTSNTETEKLWALFAWMSSRDRANTFPELMREAPPDGSPLSCLSAIMRHAHTHMYVPLLTKLLRAAKIPCKTVLVKTKATAPELGEPPKSSTSIVMALADKNWRFIQPNWGCCYAKRVRTVEEWKLVQGVAGEKGGIASATPDLLGFDREDFWFMVDPDIMAYSFLSEDPKLQLLPRTISQEEFRMMAKLYNPFFEMGFTSISPAKCKYDVNEDFTIEIGLPKNCDAKFDYAIYKRAMDTDTKHVKYKDIKQFVFMERVGNKLRAKFQIPFIGVYKFEINGTDNDNIFPMTLVEYFIDCKTPNFKCRPNPTNPLNEWGAGPDAQDAGLKPVGDTGGLVEATKGQAILTFQLEAKHNTKYKYTLEGQTSTTANLDDYVRNFIDNENKQTVIARIPQNGNYILKVFSKSETEKKFQHICNYLIKADRGVADLTPFPVSQNGQIGSLEASNPQLIPVSHKEAIINHTSDGFLEIRMKQEGDADVDPVLTTKDHRDKSDYVYSYQKGTERMFVLFLPEAGWYDLKINKKSASFGDKTETLFQYVITNDKPKKNCVPFPTKTSSWQDNFIIHEPRDGLLKQNIRQTFRLSIKDAEHVILSRDGGEVNMTRVKDDDSDDIWEGRLDTGSAGGLIKISVKPKNKEEVQVMEYRVVTSFDEQQLKQQQSEADQKAERRQREIERREQEEARKAEERKKSSNKKEEALKDDFDKNKNRYYEKQKQLEEEALKKNPEGPSFKEFQGREESKKDMGDWKGIFDDISQKMPIERLREAIRSRDKHRLDIAVRDAKDHNVAADNHVLVEAQRELEIIRVREELREAMDSRDADAISTKIQKIYKNTFYMSRLQPDAAEAYQLLQRLMKIREMKVSHLDMCNATLSEMRRYNSPPKAVHKVMQATLLVFGEDEETTESWRYCQQQINPNSGSSSLIRRVMDFQPSSVHPEVAARSRQILEQYEMEKIQDVSPAAATFYAWTMGVVDMILSSKEDKVTPANVRRQRELFGRPLPSPRRNYDYRFSSWKNTKLPKYT